MPIPIAVPPTAPYVVRAVLATDEPAIEGLLGGLDEESRYRRWFSYAVDVRRASSWAAHPEVDAALGFVAVAGTEVIGHGVMIPIAAGRAEVAFEVAARWRRHGVAGALLEAIIAAALSSGVRELCADVLESNHDMLAVLREHGRHDELHGGGIASVTIAVPDAGTV